MEKKKYMQDRKLIAFTCDCCGKESFKPSSEYNRNVRLGRHNFCSRSCSVTFANKQSKGKHISEKQRKHLLSICNNRKDEYSGFRYILRNVNKRFKDVDVDLEYLKSLWDLQCGICPYSGIKLTLPTYKNNNDYFTTASLDRIDSSKGYIRGNVQFIALPINYLKSTMSDVAVKRFLKQISVYTSAFTEDETISSSENQMLGAHAGN